VKAAQGLQAFVARQEMQRQQAGCPVKGAGRCGVDIALMQGGAGRMGAKGAAGKVKHRGGGIDAAKAPAGFGMGKGGQFHTAPSAMDRDFGLRACALGQQDAGHLVQVMQAGHHAQRTSGIAGDGIGIVEMGHPGLVTGAHGSAGRATWPAGNLKLLCGVHICL